jgi:Sulfotransferase domain
MSKLFGIGFHRTGTKSLGRALQVLGYRVTGPNGVNDPDIAANAFAMCRSLISEFDAFQDNPWPILFRNLDRACPGSKFILTIRPRDEWIRSVVGVFGQKSTPMREWIYGQGMGSPLGHESVYLRRYDEHNRDVAAYFARRPHDLLTFRITEGEGWYALCTFLGREPPPVPFPRINASR